MAEDWAEEIRDVKKSQEVISCQKAVSDSTMADSASNNSSDSTCSSCAKMKEVC